MHKIISCTNVKTGEEVCLFVLDHKRLFRALHGFTETKIISYKNVKSFKKHNFSPIDQWRGNLFKFKSFMGGYLDHGLRLCKLTYFIILFPPLMLSLSLLHLNSIYINTSKYEKLGSSGIEDPASLVTVRVGTRDVIHVRANRNHHCHHYNHARCLVIPSS